MVTYVEYQAGSNKGSVKQGDLFNSPFALGDVDPSYTGNAVVENLVEGQTKVAWTPVIPESFKAFTADGTVADDVTVAADGTIDFGSHTDIVKVAYLYDNIVIPQNDLPTLKAEMKSIPLVARARRIAVFYSQIAAFQAKTDYGFDLGDQLAEKAVGQLSYEIDTEVCDLLVKTAGEAPEELVWSKTLPIGVR